MNTTPVQRRAPIADVLADLLDFMDEQIAEAVADSSSQLAAIEEAACAIPVMHDRLREDDVIWTNFVLMLGVRIERNHWRDWWTAFAKMERDEFLREVGELAGPEGRLASLKFLLKR
jgi:hypothetical protein